MILHQHLFARVFLPATLILATWGCTKSGLQSASVSPSTFSQPISVYPNRAAAMADYQNNYLGAALESTGWTGNTDNCDPGTTSAANKAMVLQRLNYFRRLVGLPDSVVLVDSLNDKAQQAALMMKANNRLDHYPDVTWHCFSPDGQLAAARSDLALGVSGPDAVTAYIQDAGLTNVGHRRWILFPPLVQAGTGDTDFSNALWLIGDFGTRPPVPFVAYPGNGYIPSSLVFPYWSFSMASADFSQASVQVTGPSNEPRSVSLFTPQSGCGDNTLVWNMNDLNTDTLSTDQTFHVTVSNLTVNGQPKEYQYTVTVMAVQNH